jgi:hypothetical protein
MIKKKHDYLLSNKFEKMGWFFNKGLKTKFNFYISYSLFQLNLDTTSVKKESCTSNKSFDFKLYRAQENSLKTEGFFLL